MSVSRSSARRNSSSLTGGCRGGAFGRGRRSSVTSDPPQPRHQTALGRPSEAVGERHATRMRLGVGCGPALAAAWRRSKPTQREVPPTRPGTYHSSRGVGLGGRLLSRPSHDAQPPPVTLLSGAERAPTRFDPQPQIRSLVRCVDLVGSRRIWPAHGGSSTVCWRVLSLQFASGGSSSQCARVGRVAPGEMTGGMTSGVNEKLPEPGCSTGSGGMLGAQVPEGSQPPGKLP
jgi:hypothetical protein